MVADASPADWGDPPENEDEANASLEATVPLTASRADWRSGATVRGLMDELHSGALDAAADLAAEAAQQPRPRDSPEAFDEDRRSVEVVSTVSSSSIIEVEDELSRVARLPAKKMPKPRPVNPWARKEVRITEEQPSEGEGTPRPRNHGDDSDDSSY